MEWIGSVKRRNLRSASSKYRRRVWRRSMGWILGKASVDTSAWRLCGRSQKPGMFRPRLGTLVVKSVQPSRGNSSFLCFPALRGGRCLHAACHTREDIRGASVRQGLHDLVHQAANSEVDSGGVRRDVRRSGRCDRSAQGGGGFGRGSREGKRRRGTFGRANKPREWPEKRKNLLEKRGLQVLRAWKRHPKLQKRSCLGDVSPQRRRGNALVLAWILPGKRCWGPKQPHPLALVPCAVQTTRGIFLSRYTAALGEELDLELKALELGRAQREQASEETSSRSSTQGPRQRQAPEEEEAYWGPRAAKGRRVGGYKSNTRTLQTQLVLRLRRQLRRRPRKRRRSGAVIIEKTPVTSWPRPSCWQFRETAARRRDPRTVDRPTARGRRTRTRRRREGVRRRRAPRGSPLMGSSGDSWDSASDDSSSSKKEKLTAPLKRRSKKKPGSVLQMLLQHARSQLDQTSKVGIGGEDTVNVVKGVKMVSYFAICVRPQLGNAMGQTRELHHISQAIDLLRQGELDRLGDVLAGRFMSVHQSVLDGTWSTARHLELLALEDGTAVGPKWC